MESETHQKKPPDESDGGNSAEIVIERLSWGGDGVGRIHGKAVFTPMTAPGDHALVTLERTRRSWSRGRLLQLVAAGPGRVQPPCPLFGSCGGCQWLHISPEVQRTEKTGILRDALQRIGGINPPGRIGMTPSPGQLGYRHRARLHAGLAGGLMNVGFFRTASHDICPLERCPILTPALNAVVALLLPIFRNGTWAPAALRTVDLASDWFDSTVRLSFQGNRGLLIPPRPVSKKIRALAGAAGIDLVLPGMRDTPLALTDDPNGPRAHRGAFTQVNLRLNAALVREVVRLAAPSAGDMILDLFCGAGNYSLPLAAAGAEVLGVDSSRPAVESALKNAGRMALDRAGFRRGPAADLLDEIQSAGTSCRTVIVNPPRRGCREIIPALIALRPSRIVMVSCDPATFARDAATLAEGGYEMKHLHTFDLFPQTYHFETVALFAG